VGYTQKVVVIGGGISGLACAYRLRQLGISCLVLESTKRPGGVIATVRRNGFLFETGPQCPRFPASVWQLVRDLHLESEFVAGDARAKRYILRDGSLHAAPFSPGALLTTRLLGLASKYRILSEAFGTSHPPGEEESLASFVQRKFGVDVLDNLVDPLVSTVFFGDSYQMGMQSAFPAIVEWERDNGSVARGAIRARNSKRTMEKLNGSSLRSRPSDARKSLKVTDALPSLGSFQSGMGRLPERLAEELQEQIKYGAEVSSISPSSSRDGGLNPGWQIGVWGGEKIAAGHIILAVPAYAAAKLLENSAPGLAANLKAIEYAPMWSVSSAYERSQIANPLDGFGFMAPRRGGLHTICTFWNSSLFPKRAPEGKVLMTSFARVVASGDGAIREGEELADAVERENARILGIGGGPVERLVWNNPLALPQYNVGHATRVRKIFDILQTVPNLHLTGNFLRGRSIGECVENAVLVSGELHSQLRGQGI
jgi:protoporphyrinogen/coproporphyrinogen III oxidase